MNSVLSALAGLANLARAVMELINRKDIEAAGRARQVAEQAAASQEREDDANAATKRARAALRGPGADGLRDAHYRD